MQDVYPPSTAAPLEFKINSQLENGNLWICIMSFFNEKHIEVYSRIFVATNANEGWTNQFTRNPSNLLPDIENYYDFNIATKFFKRLQIFNAAI